MSHPVTVKPRRRAGSWSTFDRRYEPIDTTEGSVLRDWDDPLVQAADERNVWTVLDCDGRLYVSPGFATVNYMGRIVTRHQWSDIESCNPGYCY